MFVIILVLGSVVLFVQIGLCVGVICIVNFVFVFVLNLVERMHTSSKLYHRRNHHLKGCSFQDGSFSLWLLTSESTGSFLASWWMNKNQQLNGDSKRVSRKCFIKEWQFRTGYSKLTVRNKKVTSSSLFFSASSNAAFST